MSKILLLGRFDLFDNRGGDTVQVENTAAELKKLGVDLEIKTSLDFDPSGYDLIHIFQLDWIPEIYQYVKKLENSGKPTVLSPIHHNIEEVKKFDDEYVFDFRRISKVLFKDQFSRDTFKNVYRSLRDPRRVIPTLITIFKGFKNCQKYTLLNSSAVLVQTDAEARDLKNTFNLDFWWVKVPNGVGDNFLKIKNSPSPLAFEDYILCVGRIEPRKNQLNIIEAVKDLREEFPQVRLVFIGLESKSKHQEYITLFRKELAHNEWISHLEKVAYQDMPLYYKYAKVGVSASWFETTGLTSLEALFCGTNAVASGDRARECLGSYASYCQPDKVSTIYQALKTEYLAKRPSLPEEIKEIYTWKNAALKTLEVYNKLLGK